jgi:tRNA A37 methylthiotransferase MiaB
LKTVSRKSPKVGFVSLGCPKALVDSERILTRLRAEGYEVAASYRAADLVVVNTCGFIDAAVDESLDAIGEALAENGKVIVTGCLGAQPQKILDRHPQVLKITGPQRYEEVVAAVHEHLPPKHEPFLDLIPAQGVKLTPRHYAYLKISEGCNHRCSFCIIPSMRGDLVSRSQVCRTALAQRRAQRPLLRSSRRAGRTRCMDSPALRLSLSPRRQSDRTDGGRTCFALSRHSVSTCERANSETDEASGRR